MFLALPSGTTQSIPTSSNISFLLYLSKAYSRDLWTWRKETQSDGCNVGRNPQGSRSPEEAPGLAGRGQSDELLVGGYIYAKS